MTANEEKSIVRKTETALDDLVDLWRRRKLFCILVLLVVCLPAIISMVAIPELRSRLKKAEAARDKAQLQLAPFLAAAEDRFPSARPEDGLQLLIQKIEEVGETVEDSGKKMDAVVQSMQSLEANMPARNALPSNAADILQANLRQCPNKYTVSFETNMGDAQSQRLASQISSIFRAAGWPIGYTSQSMSIPPITGFRMKVREMPPVTVQQAMTPLFQGLAITPIADIDESVEKDSIVFVIGAR